MKPSTTNALKIYQQRSLWSSEPFGNCFTCCWEFTIHLKINLSMKNMLLKLSFPYSDIYYFRRYSPPQSHISFIVRLLVMKTEIFFFISVSSLYHTHFYRCPFRSYKYFSSKIYKCIHYICIYFYLFVKTSKHIHTYVYIVCLLWIYASNINS